VGVDGPESIIALVREHADQDGTDDGDSGNPNRDVALKESWVAAL
jgi:hypothetical protein